MDEKHYLDGVYQKSDYALKQIKSLRGKIRFPSQFWYHAIGLLNAHYALCDEIKNVVGQVKHGDLGEIAKAWLRENRTDISAAIGRARNLVTHRAELQLDHGLVLEDDFFNDTQHPEPYTVISIKTDGDTFSRLSAEEFLDIFQQAFELLLAGVDTIEERFRDHNKTTAQLYDRGWGDQELF